MTQQQQHNCGRIPTSGNFVLWVLQVQTTATTVKVHFLRSVLQNLGMGIRG
jgi:hypothetical protein